MKPGELDEPAKKPYQTPELRLFGDLGTLTEAKKLKGALDGYNIVIKLKS